MSSSATIVSQFAVALDAEDYPAAKACLAEGCVYDSPAGELVGPTAIVASYQANGESARKRFDSVVYRHEVTALVDGWHRITFFDELAGGGRTHVFRCHQRVQVAAGRITHIVHEEIPGERAALDAFVKSLG